MPKEMGSVEGFKIIREHFDTGTLYPVNILIEQPQGDLTLPAALQEIEKTASSLKEIKGVSRVNYVASPAAQISALSQQVWATARKNLSPASASQLSSSKHSLRIITCLQYPGITVDQLSDYVSDLTCTQPDQKVENSSAESPDGINPIKPV
jgi:uncharacterized membrane protein YdfJ with MMPL/SSD domain